MRTPIAGIGPERHEPNTGGRISAIFARRMRPLVFVLALIASGACSLSPVAAWAESRTDTLAAQLRTNDDYRVRTQAALALGASGDERAVTPLCEGLGDSNVSVRVAAAAALGKLAKPAAAPCLKVASAKESSASVKAQIQKSLAAVEGGASADAPPPPGPDAKFYVALQVTNKTGRSSADVDALVRSAVQTKLLARPGYAVAPRGETVAQGGQIVKSKKLKGFFLMATIEAPTHDGANLTQVVRVTMASYPAKSLQGEFAPKLTWSDTPKGDVASENELMKMCVESAIETFQKVAASL
jgi:hypothetical protein